MPYEHLIDCCNLLEAAEAPAEEEKKLFAENSDAIFNVLYEYFVDNEANFRKGKKGLKELVSMLGVLKKILIYLAPLVNTKWQIEKIGNIIDKSLAYSNPQQVRVIGFELLLYFIEALQNSMEEQQILLFATSLNLSPFVAADSKVTLKHTPKQSIFILKYCYTNSNNSY